MALLRTLEMLRTGERVNDRLAGGASPALWAGPSPGESEPRRRHPASSALVTIRAIIGALSNGHVGPMGVT